jgi:hypothetical protein
MTHMNEVIDTKTKVCFFRSAMKRSHLTAKFAAILHVHIPSAATDEAPTSPLLPHMIAAKEDREPYLRTAGKVIVASVYAFKFVILQLSKPLLLRNHWSSVTISANTQELLHISFTVKQLLQYSLQSNQEKQPSFTKCDIPLISSYWAEKKSFAWTVTHGAGSVQLEGLCELARRYQKFDGPIFKCHISPFGVREGNQLAIQKMFKSLQQRSMWAFQALNTVQLSLVLDNAKYLPWSKQWLHTYQKFCTHPV